MARLSIRIDLDGRKRGEKGRIGPGKIQLLEAIAAHGSISAAGRAIRMSYKRAWDLVAEMNATFAAPVVKAQGGGRQGGGAVLTALGLDLVTRYRAIEAAAEDAAAQHLDAVQSAARPGEAG